MGLELMPDKKRSCSLEPGQLNDAEREQCIKQHHTHQIARKRQSHFLDYPDPGMLAASAAIGIMLAGWISQLLLRKS